MFEENILDQHVHSMDYRPDNLIFEFFTKEQVKNLYYNCMRVDIPDNNIKAEMIKAYLPSKEFDELGTGTNRMAFLHNGLVVKIALDRRGIVDSYTEFKRSIELPAYLAKTYESNLLISIQQYVNVMDKAQFMSNEPVIKEMLAELSEDYLFEDLGYNLDNCYNWGYIESEDGPELRILDYGYLYPLALQDKKKLFRCPVCGSKLKWDSNYVKLICDSPTCSYKIRPFMLKDKMNNIYEDLENETINTLNNLKLPNFKDIEKLITNIKK